MLDGGESTKREGVAFYPRNSIKFLDSEETSQVTLLYFLFGSCRRG